MKNRIIIETPSGEKSSIELNGVVRYTKRLNLVSEGAFNIYVPQSKRSLFQTNSKIYIYRNGVLDWKGVLTQIEKFSGGQIGGYIKGYEIKLSHENGAYTNSPYISTPSATIAEDIINESSYFTKGTIDTGLTIDFRISPSSSLMNALQNLIKKTNQDIEITYSDTGNDKVGVVNFLGNTSASLVLNDGREIVNPQVSEALPLGNHIIVYGKGDGEFQIKAEASDSGSITQYGKIYYVHIDPTIISNSEASAMADALLEKYKDPQKYYSFDVINPDLDISLGDVVKINAPDLDLDSQDVRITAIERKIFSDKEFLSIEVSDISSRQALKKLAELNAERELKNRDFVTYSQGSGNTLTWSSASNAKQGASLKIPLYVSSLLQDETGSFKISQFTLDYDVDGYRASSGTASEDSVSVDLSPGETINHKHDASDSGHDHGLPTMTSSSYTLIVYLDNASAYGDTISSSSWSYLCQVEYPSGTYDFLYLYLDCEVTGTLPDNIYFLFEPTYGNEVYISFPVKSGAPYVKGTFLIPVMATTGSTGYVNVYAQSDFGNTVDVSVELYKGAKSHAHSISGYDTNSDLASVSDSYKSPSLSGYSATHDHNVTISDEFDESGSVNATSVNIYLDYWNGSVWVNKYSILSTGKTLDTGVDLSKGGTYPDATGYWRVRIEPNSTNPDYVQGIVTVKHNLQN